MTATDALYVYGIVPGDTSADVFSGVPGIDAAEPVRLVAADGVAAITSGIPLAEFGAEALERNLKNAGWLEQKVQAHNRVLAAAVGKTTVLPLRFGAIYRGEEQVRTMLAERAGLEQRLRRLEGMLELGVKAVLDVDSLRSRLEASEAAGADEGSGRAYMERKRVARRLDEDVRAYAASAAELSHERLAAAAVDARANAAQPVDAPGHAMVLNGAYLVIAGNEEQLREAVRELESRFGADGVTYELTGPWPPYNFADEEQPE